MPDDYQQPGPQDTFDALESAEAATPGNDSLEEESKVRTDESDELRDAAETVSNRDPDSPEPAKVPNVDEDGPIPCVEPQIHEFGAHLLFSDDSKSEKGHPGSLSPYWAIVSEYEPSLADDIGSFAFDGEYWTVNEEKTQYWNGGIAAPNQSYETFNEYQVAVYAQDGLGERKATFQLRPSIPDARTSDGERINSMPKDLPYGLRVQASTSNLDPDEIVPLLERLAEEMGIRPDYFDTEHLHEHSNVYQFASYLRLVREKGEQHIVNEGGVLDQLALFGRNNRGRGEYKWDNEKVVGHMNSVVFDEGTWKNLTAKSHGVAKRVKYYHPEHARSQSTSADDDALRDPKLELQFSKEFSGADSVPWDDENAFDLEDLRREVDESVVNVLNWSGLPLRADPRTYTADHYFSLEESERDLDLSANRMPKVRESEEEQTVAYFARGDATESERSVLAALTDGGGSQSVDHLAELSDTSRSTVYRALDRFEDLVEVANAEVSFADGVVREKFQDLLGVFEDVTEWVVGGVRDLAAEGETPLDHDSPLARWARRHGITITEGANGMAVDLGGRPVSRYELVKLLRAGVNAAEESGKLAYRKFISGEFAWTQREGGRKSGQRPINWQGDVLYSSKAPR